MRITIPITVDDLVSQSCSTEPLSEHYVANERGTEQYRFVGHEYGYGGTYGPFDPWSLRNQFLAWEMSVWRSFFDMAGDFGTPVITRNDFEEWRRLMRIALLIPAREWEMLSKQFDPLKVEKLTNAVPIQFDWAVEPPTATLMGLSPLDSMIASIQLDKLQRSEFRTCAREDCKSPPFRVGTRQKIYCDMSCAHLAAVRASRDRAADAKRKAAEKALARKKARATK